MTLVREKAENDKAQGLEQRTKLEKQYNPIINATKESTNKITDELKNNRAIAESQKGAWKSSWISAKLNPRKNFKIKDRRNSANFLENQDFCLKNCENYSAYKSAKISTRKI